MKRVAFAGLTLLFLAGCVEFVGPEEPGVPDLAAQVVVSAVLVDGGGTDMCAEAEDGVETCAPDGTAAASVLAVSAQFFPGTDAEGWPRPIVTDTLHVMGEALLPSDVDDRGWYQYSNQLTVPPPGRAGVVVPMALPVAGPGATEPMQVTVALPGRRGPDHIRLVRGEDLFLPLSPWPGAPSPAPTLERWQLELTGGGPLFVVSSAGRPPASLFVPAEWIPPSPSGSVSAKLVLDQRTASGGPEEDSVATLMRVELKWTIELEDSKPND